MYPSEKTLTFATPPQQPATNITTFYELASPAPRLCHVWTKPALHPYHTLSCTTLSLHHHHTLTFQGAGSPIMIDAVERITNALQGPGPADPEVKKTALARSMILSVDMAHAVHPNYASKVRAVHLG